MCVRVCVCVRACVCVCANRCMHVWFSMGMLYVTAGILPGNVRDCGRWAFSVSFEYQGDTTPRKYVAMELPCMAIQSTF